MTSHSPQEVRRYDTFKTIVLLILLLILALLLLRSCQPATPVSTPLATSTAEVVAAKNTATPLPPTAEPPTATSAPTLAPSPTVIAPALTSPKPGDQLTGGETTLAGTGAPGSTAQIVIDDRAVGAAPVGSDGTWSLPVKLEDGEHTIVIQSLDAGGAVAAESESVKLTVAASPTPAPTATPTPRPAAPGPAVCVGDPGIDQGATWIVGACDTMTFISKRTGVSLQALIAANPQVKNPDVIFPGQVINVPGR